ncbi:DoxX family membrane protein [Actinoplanes xinjiangensis]|uniref:Thiosulfate dehydrogenase [quinone] large subunit n=1 Tax=Actinoplanes xinjiangensis TaxID=512350 RepID=A0A316EJK7_9ACTN|nr:DoxX family membrane protein [Actinoplanes xinjiangensis]PWK32455.1 thiosulfate dehydrogenase [quinone] large subunit [Actinoplanes xinjiangensis]GIF45072.1 membrane protein [Actinoplanes xinjiangensis]
MVNIANEHESSVTTTEPPKDTRHYPGTTVAPDSATATTGRTATATRYLSAGIRIALGWVFLWAFLDKLFGLGRSTPAANAWLDGGSPTAGFLGKATTGPFSGFYHAIAGNAVVDVLFMTALLGIGLALILGIGMRIAAASGALLTVLMWTAVLPPATNPFMDDHLVYAAVLVLLALLGAGNKWGLGRRWAATPLVRRNTWLT